MENKEIDLIPESKWFEVGNKKFDVSRISAERALKAAALFNNINKGKYSKKEDKYVNYDSEYELVTNLLDVVLLLIRIDFKLENCIEWLRRRAITKKYILKTMDHKKIMDWIEEALDPILADKKKVLARENKATEAMLKLMDGVGVEALTQLLQNSVAMQGIKKNT